MLDLQLQLTPSPEAISLDGRQERRLDLNDEKYKDD